MSERTLNADLQALAATIKSKLDELIDEALEENEELVGRVHYLLEEGKLYGEDGVYTFPDGESFERRGD